MLFFSGFALHEDEHLFEHIINSSHYAVSGFSYGAIKAFEHVADTLKEGVRIDSLQLFSPAFFQTHTQSFKETQCRSYEKNSTIYLKKFLQNCYYPAVNTNAVALEKHTKKELETLLYYEWDEKKLQYVIDKGVAIDIYLGGQDRIINTQACQDFFAPFGVVHWHKNRGHFLLDNKGEKIYE